MNRIRLANKTTNIRRWSADELETLQALFNEGYSDEAIGEKLCRTAHSVIAKRCQLKLRRPYVPREEFHIHDAMVEYYPRWWILHLKKQWKEQRSISTR